LSGAHRPRIIRDKATLLSQFQTLSCGDIVCTILPLKYGEEHLLFDLVTRGTNFVPPATAQIASKPKAFQAAIFNPWMVPATTVIYNYHQLLETTNIYNRKGVNKVVLKQDRKNAGMGILLYRSIEDIYTQAANDMLSYPFVIQPYIEQSRDIRVVILGDYIEAYSRFNPDNFRNNLHCGGSAKPFSISEEIRSFCEEVMARGKFPYGHLDLMLTPENEIYLAEINLRGGLRGACISCDEYKNRRADIEKSHVDSLIKHDT
jgi:glutathione synthase/RimK-type ligase-like ATP-grasp enzyme